MSAGLRFSSWDELHSKATQFEVKQAADKFLTYVCLADPLDPAAHRASSRSPATAPNALSLRRAFADTTLAVEANADSHRGHAAACGE